VEKRVRDFAESDVGQEMIILDKLGYRLADNQNDLTLYQQMFLLFGYAEMHRRSNKQSNSKSKGTQEKDEVKGMLR